MSSMPTVGLILVLIIVAIGIALFLQTKQKNKELKYDDENCDVLFQHTTNKLTIFQLVNEACKYKPDFIIGNNSSTYQPTSEMFDCDDMPNQGESFHWFFGENNVNQVACKYKEFWTNTDYGGVSREKFRGYSVNAYNLSNYRFYIIKVQRLDNLEKFELVSINETKELINPQSDDNYKAIASILNFLKNRKDAMEYILTGNFGTHGHEDVIKYYFPNYHVCDFSKMPNYSANSVLCSRSGLAVSPKLYQRVEYRTSFCEKQSKKNFIITADLYKKHNTPGVFITNWKMQKAIEYITKNLQEGNFYNKPGKFNPEIHTKDLKTPISFNILLTDIIKRAADIAKPTKENYEF